MTAPHPSATTDPRREEDPVDPLETFRREEATLGGTLSVAASDLDGARPVAYRSDEVMRAASTIKVPLLVAWLEGVAEGRFALDDEIAFGPGDAVPGSGVMKILAPGRPYLAIDLAHLMICVSDNTATNLLMRRVTVERVNALAERHGWRATRLFGPLQAVPPSTPATTSARDLHAMMRALWAGELLPPRETEVARGILLRQQYTDHLGRYIGYDAYQREVAAHPVSIASKSGSLPGIRNEVAVVRDGERGFVVGMTVSVPADPRFHLDHPAHGAIARVTKALFDHYLGA